MTTLAYNKRAGFDYQISDKYEAGLVLSGQEVKSVKMGHISLKESFVTIKGNELYLTNAHITPYKHAGVIKNYDPTSPRKLLLKKSEIKHLTGKVRAQGLTLVPIRVYIKKRPASTRGNSSSTRLDSARLTRGGYIKLEFGIGKGKKKFDKREDIAKREDKRKMKRALRG